MRRIRQLNIHGVSLKLSYKKKKLFFFTNFIKLSSFKYSKDWRKNQLFISLFAKILLICLNFWYETLKKW